MKIEQKMLNTDFSDVYLYLCVATENR